MPYHERICVWEDDGKFFAQHGPPWGFKAEGVSIKDAVDKVKVLLHQSVDESPVDWVDFPKSGKIHAYNIERNDFKLEQYVEP